MRTLKLFAVSAIIIIAFCFGKLVNTTKQEQSNNNELLAAKKYLGEVKHNLQKAASDYNGHRTKAVDYVDLAMKEINDGLATQK
jgi:hypothetical protein